MNLNLSIWGWVWRVGRRQSWMIVNWLIVTTGSWQHRQLWHTWQWVSCSRWRVRGVLLDIFSHLLQCVWENIVMRGRCKKTRELSWSKTMSWWGVDASLAGDNVRSVGFCDSCSSTGHGKYGTLVDTVQDITPTDPDLFVEDKMLRWVWIIADLLLQICHNVII